MSATEAILFSINVEGAQAKRELDALRNSAETLGGGFGKLNASLVEQSMRVEALRSKQLELAGALAMAGKATERDTMLVGALRRELEATTATLNGFATAQGRVVSQSAQAQPQMAHWQQNFGALTTGANQSAKSFWNMEGAAKGLHTRLAPQAAAISGISAALGENAGQAGKAVAGLGQLAAAYSAGGPWGAVIALAGAGVIKLIGHWDDLIAKQDEALGKKFAGTDSASALIRAADEGIAEIRDASLNPSERAYKSAGRQIKQAEELREKARKKLIDESKLSASMSFRAREELIAKNELVKEEIGLYDEAIEKLETLQGLSAARAAAGTADKKPKDPSAWKVDKYLRYDFEIPGDPAVVSNTDELAGSQAARTAMAQAGRDERALLLKQEVKDYLWAEQQKEEAYQISMRKRLADEQAFSAAMMDLTRIALVDTTQAAVNEATGVFGEYLAMRIEGEEKAEEKATAAFLQGIGNQLVGIGTRSLFEGGAKLFNPVTAPIGVAEMAFGGSAIAAGLGLGAGGAALAHTAAGGTVGRPLPEKDKAERDRGVNSGRGGGGGSRQGEGYVLNVTFAGAGPAPEQVGESVNNALATFNRRAGLGPTGASIRQGPRALR